MDETEPTRPAGVTAAAVVLVLLAALSAGVGVVASWASNCCGSADPADPMPALVGFAIGAGLGLSGVGLMRGSTPVWVLVAFTGVAPLACLAAAPHSSDLGRLAPVALVGWIGFALFLRLPRVAGWLGRGVSRS